jgi:hypothetical protein
MKPMCPPRSVISMLMLVGNVRQNGSASGGTSGSSSALINSVGLRMRRRYRPLLERAQ